jgi:hypothetical protein
MATSYEVREELTQILGRDLLGPWEGPAEELAPGSNPRERYLVGVLGPKDADIEPDITDVGLGDGADDNDPELREITPLLSPKAGGRIWASSMGLSFCVPEQAASVLVSVGWGQYRKTESEKYLRKDGTGGRTVWKRYQITNQIEVPLGQPRFREPAHEEFPEVELTARIVRQPGRRVVDLALVNRQELPDSSKDAAWLFQPSLTVTAADAEAAVFLPLSDPVEDPSVLDGKDFEDRQLELLFRDCLEHASGRNVAVDAEVREGERRAWRLATTWLPSFDVPQTVAPRADDTPLLAGLVLGMERLASLPPAELTRVLLPLADGYSLWLDERAQEAATSLPEHLRDTGAEAISRARKIADRVRAGIGLLGTPGNAPLEAFRFTNKAMALQRQHSEIVRARAKDPSLSLADAQRQVEEQGQPTWRPFQLAFVLLNLPALTDPRDQERAAGQGGIVDLLYFPTGGGKTEAYLGLIAYTLAIRRLQGLVGSGSEQRSGTDGVGVLMRYTLRLLTAQQFQRAATLICACERLRHEDWRLGERPFRIGLWVGVRVSPNWFIEAAAQVDQAREGHNVRSSALQVLNCPWCGTELRADRDLYPDDTFRRVIIYCGDPDGECPFSRRQSGGPDVHPLNRGLPVLTVDEEIYRLAPSLVIATVDKLAQLPWQGFAGTLFGRVSQWCPRHGYRHGDLDSRIGCGGHHNRKGDAQAVDSQPVVRLQPPDLIIQDELHLISGALGTTVGLFEAAVDELCTWQLDGQDTGPKIVASTATVKRAAEQTLQLFARDLAIFPAPVLDQGDTFFSRQQPVTAQSPGRRYLGVCAHGVRLKSAEIKLAEILLEAGQYLLDQHGVAADPYLTLVGYFNATRELAGMRRYLDDDITTRIRRNGRRRGLADRLVPMKQVLTLQELTSRVPSAVIAESLRQLEVGFDPAADSSAALEALWREVAAARQEKREPRLPPRREPGPADVVLATSMLQVGVDVPRLGLMVVTGQPKNTAEYLQASGRVGRDPERPGLVVTLYNWARPRDLAHYEHFAHYHATAAMDVEALSVTPYSRRALDREFAAAFIAAVRNLDEQYSRNRDAHDLPLDGEVVTRVRRRLRQRASQLTGSAFDGGAYLDEKAKALLDEWARRRDAGGYRLGYQPQKTEAENIVGLLDKPEHGGWTALTVGMSMRETENEINLLLPRQSLADVSAADGPAWAFAASGEEPEDEDILLTDELGETA